MNYSLINNLNIKQLKNRKAEYPLCLNSSLRINIKNCFITSNYTQCSQTILICFLSFRGVLMCAWGYKSRKCTFSCKVTSKTKPSSETKSMQQISSYVFFFLSSSDTRFNDNLIYNYQKILRVLLFS